MTLDRSPEYFGFVSVAEQTLEAILQFIDRRFTKIFNTNIIHQAGPF